jgi:hypothetical protein
MKMGAELPQDGELPGRTTGYWARRQTSSLFPLQAPQFGQCGKMEGFLITGLNGAPLGSHAVYVSQPQAVALLIEEAARGALAAGKEKAATGALAKAK